MNRETHRYYSYLIRILEAHTNDEQIYRASLERPGLKERVGFSDIDELFTFIKEDVSSKDSNKTEKS